MTDDAQSNYSVGQARGLLSQWEIANEMDRVVYVALSTCIERIDALETVLAEIVAICAPLIYPYDTPPGIVEIHDKAESALEGTT